MLNFRKHVNLKRNDICIIKLGSLAVTNENGGIAKEKIANICKDLIKLKEFGIHPILVSSGAINAGREFFQLPEAVGVSKQQAASSIGQHLLMQEYDKHLEVCAQVLLTHEDLKNKKRSHNVRATIFELLKQNVVPIINENDAVSFSEITVGDNDQLSAMLAQTMEASLLLMISKTPGLFNKDPKEEDSHIISEVKYDDEFHNLKTKTKSLAGRGGMATKIFAVRKCTPLGIPVILSGGKLNKPILTPLTKEVGTIFLSAPKVDSKKAWILSRVKTDSKVSIDEGAVKALMKNASLLPVGIKKVNGNFSRGDSIQIVHKRKVIGWGVCEYNNAEVEKIMGLKTSEIQKMDKNFLSKVFIHKNNLVLK